MKVYLDTTISPSMKVYDTTEPTGEGPSILRNIIQPQVRITDDEDRQLFVYGENPANYLPWMGLFVLGVLVLIKYIRKK